MTIIRIDRYWAPESPKAYLVFVLINSTIKRANPPKNRYSNIISPEKL
jgi:hypothetical protein